jgi:hypothetical protein
METHCPACGDLRRHKTVAYDLVRLKSEEGCDGCELLLSIIAHFLGPHEWLSHVTIKPEAEAVQGPMVLRLGLPGDFERGVEIFRHLGMLRLLSSGARFR